MSGKRKPWHGGTYARRAKMVRTAAYADTTTRCWRCGKTRSEHGQQWQAGHVIDGDPSGPLLPECRRCNASAGATMGNLARLGRVIQTAVGPSREW